MSTGGGVRGAGKFYSSQVPPFKIEVCNVMPFELASRSILDRFWLPKWVPNRESQNQKNVVLESFSLLS